MSRPSCDHNRLVCPAITWADTEVERLRALLRRHDDFANKEKRDGLDHLWVPEFKRLAADTRKEFAAEQTAQEMKP